MDLNKLMNFLINFMLVLYSNPGLPRNIVQIIVDYVNNFLKEFFLPSLKNDILESLKNQSISYSCYKEIEQHFNTTLGLH